MCLCVSCAGTQATVAAVAGTAAAAAADTMIGTVLHAVCASSGRVCPAGMRVQRVQRCCPRRSFICRRDAAQCVGVHVCVVRMHVCLTVGARPAWLVAAATEAAAAAMAEAEAAATTAHDTTIAILATGSGGMMTGAAAAAAVTTTDAMTTVIAIGAGTMTGDAAAAAAAARLGSAVEAAGALRRGLDVAMRVVGWLWDRRSHAADSPGGGYYATALLTVVRAWPRVVRVQCGASCAHRPVECRA